MTTFLEPSAALPWQPLSPTGWGLVSCDESHGGCVPARCYTVGNARAGLPDLVIFGIAPEEAQVALNALCLRLRSTKLPFNTKLHGFLAELPLVLKPIPVETADEMCPAMFQGAFADKVFALQVVWPDQAGVFYWEQGFDRAHAHLQPVLAIGDILKAIGKLH